MAKVRERPKVSDRSGNLCCLKFDCGRLAAQQNYLPVRYSYCNLFFVQDVCGEFGIINVHLYDNFIWKVGAGGVGDTFHLESGNSVFNGYICALFVSESGVRCCQYVCA